MKTILATAVALAVLTAARIASADGQFDVDRTRIDLSSADPAQAIVVENKGSEPLRLEVTAFAWQDDRDGTSRLSPTNDLTLRPALVEIAPGASKPIRIGTALHGSTNEASYRVFIEELPDKRPASAGIHVRTRLGIPVFVAPAKAGSASADVALASSDDGLAVDVRTTGPLHVKLSKLRVRALSGDDVRGVREIAGWYVLPGVTRRFAVGETLATVCAGAQHVVAEAIDETGATTWTSSPLACPK